MYVYVRLSVVFTSLSLFLCYNQFCFMAIFTELWPLKNAKNW